MTIIDTSAAADFLVGEEAAEAVDGALVYPTAQEDERCDGVAASAVAA